MDRRLLLAACLAVVLLHGVLFWLDLRPRQLVGDELRYTARAEAFARGETPPVDLLWPPLYPRVMGCVLAWSGGSRTAIVAIQSLLLLATALLVRDLAMRLAGRGPGADFAGLLMLLYPPLAGYAHTFWPEIGHLFLWVAAVWILAARRDRTSWLALLGVALGLALLSKSLLLGFLPAILVATAVAKPWRRAALHALLVIACLAATVAPTVWSNFATEGVPTISDSSRFNLWLGLTDRTRRDRLDASAGRLYVEFEASAATFRERNRILGERIRALVNEQGVVATLGNQLSRQYFRLFDKNSLLTDQLPGGLLEVRGRGYLDAPGWLATLLCWASWSLHGLLLAAFPLGLALYPPRRQAWGWLVLAFVAYNLLVFLFLHVKSRYLVQILPIIVLYAAPALARLVKEPRQVWGEIFGWRRVAVAGCAASLLFFAFGA